MFTIFGDREGRRDCSEIKMMKDADSIINHFFYGTRIFHRGWAPSCDVYEEGDKFIILVELGGVTKDNLSISIEEGAIINLSGTRPYPIERKDDRNCHEFEINFGDFSRRIKLPETVDPDRVEVSNINGIFKIALYKKEPRKVRIK